MNVASDEQIKQNDTDNDTSQTQMNIKPVSEEQKAKNTQLLQIGAIYLKGVLKTPLKHSSYYKTLKGAYDKGLIKIQAVGDVIRRVEAGEPITMLNVIEDHQLDISDVVASIGFNPLKLFMK